MSVNNYFDDLSSIESSSYRRRHHHQHRRERKSSGEENDRISEQETVIKSLTYAVQVSVW